MRNKLYKLMNWPAIESIIYSEESNPHQILGPHVYGSDYLVQTYQPEAKTVSIFLKKSQKEIEMEMMDEGFFAILIPKRKLGDYEFIVTFEEEVKRVEDPYRFKQIISNADIDKFNAGIHYNIYDKLGAHVMEVGGVKGVHFAVWAPNAIRVSVVGDFNNWDGRTYPMRKLEDSGVYEIFIPGEYIGQNYKYELKIKGGLTYLKADPYAFSQQLRPDTASIICDHRDFQWMDDNWLKDRAKSKWNKLPISVYELYLGSFRQKEDGSYYNYRELAPLLIDYIKEMGYTHIELMPIMEHPLDGSWGYQVIGYYAPTARYGTPEDFMYFMNAMHQAGIGVILDWVPAHFPKDDYGLSNFDGTCLYEHQDKRQGEHPHWGTLIYNYGRPQVSNYLIANALYWVEKFHIDGIRVDAVASMLYLDYGKNDGEWVANMYGGNENLEAMEFFKHLNSILHKRNKGVLSIAEESTAWPMITGDLAENGLGFDYKWNMGWMNDCLEYMKNDPYFRSHHHGELTFSMIYAYSEKFMLALSHDEVVHGKSSLLGKMPGTNEEKFANLRLLYTLLFMHPGKKLHFMGQELGEWDEWNEQREIQWSLEECEGHKGIHGLVKQLNKTYQTFPALLDLDEVPEGFEWISCMNQKDCTLSFIRKTAKKEDTLLVVFNFANVLRNQYQVGLPYAGKYKEILSTDNVVFGGEGSCNPRVKLSVEEEFDGREHSMRIKLAPLSASIFTYSPFTTDELKKIAEKQALREKKLLAEKAQKKAKQKRKPTLKDQLEKKVIDANEEIAKGSEAKVQLEKKEKVGKKKRKA